MTREETLALLVREAVAILKGEQVRSDFVERAEKALADDTSTPAEPDVTT
jgi:hypothetical protein